MTTPYDKEKQVMYAMYYNDIETSTHGIFYSCDRKSVEEFTTRIKNLIGKDADVLDEEDMFFHMEELWVEFPDIREIDGIDASTVGPVQGGEWYGYQDDNNIYCFVNGQYGDDLHLWSSSERNEK